MRGKLIIVLLSICCALLATAASAAPASQRIDMKVLLLGTSGSEPSFAAWQAQLRREGVPYDQLLATPGHAPITAATLSQTLAGGIDEAKYQAVIVAVGGLPRCDEGGCASALAPEEWAALTAFEQTFNVRQLSAYAFPGADYGLNPPTFGAPLDGAELTLTTAGQAVFPYLQGRVQIGAGTWGYGATPLEGAAFSTLLADDSGNALVGVFTHPEGREEMVQTFDSNPFQLHSQLLRHGQLGWVTRGTFFGDQRNYLELHIDDIFLPDDIWDPATHTTNFNPEAAVRMTPGDVATAVAWSRATGLRLDSLYNGGGSVGYAAEHGGRDPLLSAFQANRTTFGWVNHTYDHPNLDCSARGFIVDQIEANTRWARSRGFAVNAGELVTGEHSGLANLIPGAGLLDSPSIDEAWETALGGRLAGGTYDYAITATSPHGETVASTTTVVVPRRLLLATASVRIDWPAICHALTYKVYRRVSPAGAWRLISTVPQPSTAFNAGGAVTIRFRDTGAAGTPASPPSFNGAAIDPYGQNPNFAGALRTAGVRNAGADASKPYPVTPTSATGPTYAAGTSFVENGFRVIPRWPTNVYYNTATQAQQLDEYNYLYLPPELGGGCVNSSITTCFTSPASWSDYVRAESDRIFGHMMGNDPRPHYFHQTNLAQSERPDGAVFYPVLNAMLAGYNRWFNTSVPIQQLTPTQVADLLTRQEAWGTARGVTGYIEGARVTIANGGAATLTVPLSGTEAGTLYGGTRSGWASAARGSSTHTAATAWPAPAPPPVVAPTTLAVSDGATVVAP
ncbi:MAG TPA: hypothetical protein VGO48_02860 [Conexibacter sp.]|jgi:hypothetical protein|nr:hypothetical protein [Conexibacter sp.]